MTSRQGDTSQMRLRLSYVFVLFGHHIYNNNPVIDLLGGHKFNSNCRCSTN